MIAAIVREVQGKFPLDKGRDIQLFFAAENYALVNILAFVHASYYYLGSYWHLTL